MATGTIPHALDPFPNSVNVTSAPAPTAVDDAKTVVISEAIGRDTIMVYFPMIGTVIVRDGHSSQFSINNFDAAWLAVIDVEWTKSTGTLWYKPRYKGSSISGFGGFAPSVAYY